jgi:hypothetical protein
MRNFSFKIHSGVISVVIAFTHGVTLTMLMVLMALSNYEDSLYDQILENTITPKMSDQRKALLLLERTHSLLEPRLEIFAGQGYINIRDTLFRSSDIQLLDAKGACGSHAHVLGRLLQRAGIDIRIAQMKCGDTWACHILLDAKIDGEWVVLDALYGLSFENADGSLATFKEVGDDWARFSAQLPNDYDLSYAYEDVRYTNWDKLPVLMPIAKTVLALFLGDEVETLSVRSYVLNVYQVYFWVAAMMYGCLAIFTLVFMRKRLGSAA